LKKLTSSISVDLYVPLEIHFATPEELEGWYKRFIKDDIREV